LLAVYILRGETKYDFIFARFFCDNLTNYNIG